MGKGRQHVGGRGILGSEEGGGRPGDYLGLYPVPISRIGSSGLWPFLSAQTWVTSGGGVSSEEWPKRHKKVT